MKKEYPANIILQGVVGSTAYGLAHAGSDRDVLGVYQATLPDLLGLDGHDAFNNTVHDTDPDFTFHELGKFMKTALSCNPTVMELLWLSSYDVLTPAGEVLVNLRKDFLSTPRVKGAYLRYVLAQAQRLQNRHKNGQKGFDPDLANRTQKHGRHCLRLLVAGQHLLSTGELLVDVSHIKEELFAAGELAETDPDAYFELINSRIGDLENADSCLPEHANREKINQALVELRLA